MRRSILDTSVLVGEEFAVDGELAISTVTLAELHYGVLWAPTPGVRGERLRRLAAVQERFGALPVDRSVAQSYGLLASLVREAGRSPRGRTMDLLIAATAHAHGARLVTRNPKDLRGLDDVLEIVAA